MSGYTTYQQHEPLRVPDGWNTNERKLIVQLEEILDDLYRRFNRLKLTDLSKDLQTTIISSENGVTQLTIDVKGLSSTVSSVSSTVQAQSTTISQQANQIALLVQSNGETYAIKSASIIAAINEDGSVLKLSADKISLNGVVTANGYFKILADGSMEAVNGKFSGEYVRCGSVLFREGLKISNHWYDGMFVYSRSSDGSLSANPVSYFAMDDYGNLNIQSDIIDISSPYMTNIHSDAQLVLTAKRGLDYYVSDTVGITNYRSVMDCYGNAEFCFHPDADFCGMIGSPDNRWFRGHFVVLQYQNLVQTSSITQKHGVQDLGAVGKNLDLLRPVEFIYNDDKNESKHYGLVWEEAHEVLPNICSQSDENDDRTKGINYQELSVLLLKEVQDLRARVACLEAREDVKT